MNKDKFLFMIFEQGGKLVQTGTCNKKSDIESNFMKLFYEFPFYAEFIPIDELKSVSEMTNILNPLECQSEKLNDVHVFIEHSDRKYGMVQRKIEIFEKRYYDENGKELNGVDLTLYDSFNELNVCENCENGIMEIGPECSRPASDCCGGCYRQEKCDSCNGAGTLNTNL